MNRKCVACNHIAPDKEFKSMGQVPPNRRTCPACGLVAGTMSFPIYGKPHSPFSLKIILGALSSRGPSTAFEVYYHLGYLSADKQTLVAMMGRMKTAEYIKGDGRNPETYEVNDK